MSPCCQPRDKKRREKTDDLTHSSPTSPPNVRTEQVSMNGSGKARRDSHWTCRPVVGWELLWMEHPALAWGHRRVAQSCGQKGHRWGPSPRAVTSVKKVPLAGRLLSVGCAVTQAAWEGPSCSQAEVGRPCQSPRTWPSCHYPRPEKRRKVVFDLCECVEVSLRGEILGSLLPHTSLKPSYQARRSFSHLLFTLRYS